MNIEKKRERVIDALTNHMLHRGLSRAHFVAADLVKTWDDGRIEYVYELIETHGEWTTHRAIARRIGRPRKSIEASWSKLAGLRVRDLEGVEITLFRREREMVFRNHGKGWPAGVSFRLAQSSSRTYAEHVSIVTSTEKSTLSQVQNFNGASVAAAADATASNEQREEIRDRHNVIRGAVGQQLTLIKSA